VGAYRGRRGRVTPGPGVAVWSRVGSLSLCVVKRGGRGRTPALRAGGSRAGRGLAIGPTKWLWER
jgi:hypothetical protein